MNIEVMKLQKQALEQLLAEIENCIKLNDKNGIERVKIGNIDSDKYGIKFSDEEFYLQSIETARIKGKLEMLNDILNQYDQFTNDIIQNLQNELSALNPKLIRTRENNDFGTYKNLILAYKEVLELYKEMTEKNKYGIKLYNDDNINTFSVDSDGNIYGCNVSIR
jgi:uncharacterized protein YaaR (DUF327 family)